MAGVTTNFAWPFPTNPDPANVAVDMAALAAAADGTLGNAWTTYAPVWTAVTTPPVLGTGTLTGRFKRFGKWGLFEFHLTATASTTFGTGAWRFTLPTGWTLTNLNQVAGYGNAFDLSLTTAFVGTLWSVTVGPPATVEFRTHSATAATGTAVPFAWATGDNLQVQGTVELV